MDEDEESYSKLQLTELEKQKQKLLEQRKLKERALAKLSVSTDVLELQRKRQELLEQKRMKQKELAAMGDLVDSKEKNFHEVQRLGTKEIEESHRGRTRKKGDELEGPPTKKLKTEQLTAPICHVSNATALYDIKRLFTDLKKEHRKDRKLVKEQKLQLSQVGELFDQKMTTLENNVEGLVNLLGLHTTLAQARQQKLLHTPELYNQVMGHGPIQGEEKVPYSGEASY
eukprot:TRINITY_DN5177_c0_g1_i2.p1 TRINITY_DN5177_c0_g1~~TRINITY_DN5177_c0_g1_i2.p1  ORF type:complete len:228 (+),score=63.00 TRINITY_DN5177_c0_g1_i2:116-799(+)